MKTWKWKHLTWLSSRFHNLEGLFFCWWSISLLGCKFCELVQTLIASWLAHSYKKKKLSNLPIEKYCSPFFHNLYATTTLTYNWTFNPITTHCPLPQTWLKFHKIFLICPISLPCSSYSNESTRHDTQPQFFSISF
jgi:hypothetical protein